MIVAEQKPLEEIKGRSPTPRKCWSWAVARASPSALRAARKKSPLASSSAWPPGSTGKRSSSSSRLCSGSASTSTMSWQPTFADADAVISLACGIGVQTMNEQFPDMLTVPGLNTTSWANPPSKVCGRNGARLVETACWALTGGFCPIARCAKSLLNGPCGGSQNGVCEVYAENDIPCAWHLIYDRLDALGSWTADGIRASQELAHQPGRRSAQNRAGGPATMSDNGYIVGSNLEKVLRAGHFAATGELGPPQAPTVT